jgi:hypothetical protein
MKELRFTSEDSKEVLRVIPTSWKDMYHIILESSPTECYHELMHIDAMKHKYKNIAKISNDLEFMEQMRNEV